jgi:methyl-accepting chemotaxis protein
MSFTNKIALAFVLAMSLFLITAGLTFSSLANIKTQVEETLGQDRPNLERIEDLRDKINEAEVVLFSGLIVTIAASVLSLLILRKNLNKSISSLEDGIEKIGSGNLNHKIQVFGKDELGKMSMSFNSMVENLKFTVTDVRLVSENVSIASAEIAQGNHDLSVRTEEQASSVQETSTSVADLNKLVMENALHSKTASALSESAKEQVKSGNEVFMNVISTMKTIESSSNQISSIIHLIDDIAFQTNILALNAAVEAARAGEQGRGFAVVASEVRSLAGRSANAAKEIKNLINSSAENVSQGAKLVEKAGDNMNEIVHSIETVSQLLHNIGLSGAVQSAKVHKIEEAMVSIEKSTLQNAALVEQMSAAASTLEKQAQDLVKSMSSFKT